MISLSQKADFEIQNFRESVTDLSAATSDIKDLNGKSAALIRFSVRDPNFVIDANNGILKQEQKTGEIWVYVPVGTKRLDIRHPSLGVIRGYQIGMAIKSKCTYDADIVITSERFIASIYTEDKTTSSEQYHPNESTTSSERTSQKSSKSRRSARSTRYKRSKKTKKVGNEYQDSWYSDNYYSDDLYPSTDGDVNVMNSGSSRKSKKTKKSKKKESQDQWFVIESQTEDIYNNNSYETNAPKHEIEPGMIYESSSSQGSDNQKYKKVQTQKRFKVFAGLGYNALSADGPSLHFGMGYMPIYLEAGYVFGLNKVEKVEFVNLSESLIEIYDYSCNKLWLRLGINAINMSKLQFSPQLGMSYNMIHGKSTASFKTDYFEKANTTSMFIGLRFSYEVARDIHIQLTPQYDFVVSSGDVFPIIKEIDSKAKSWGEGFGINLGLLFHF